MVRRPGAALLAAVAVRQRRRLAHDRVVDRVVGAVAGAGPDERYPRRAQAGRARSTARRSARCRCGWTRSASAIPTPTTTRCDRVDLEVKAGEHLAITGANGSGKTTLMLVLAGREPTSGTIERPGAVGLGRLGGTAVVMQHPESQVLGTRVADDVVWGLPPGTTTDVTELLAKSAWSAHAERDTGSLSGGELQRLAVAAALAREPALLIADEVTSMVDQRGPRSAARRAVRPEAAAPHGAGAHHPLQQRGRIRRPHHQSQRVRGQHRHGRDDGRPGDDADDGT